MSSTKAAKVPVKTWLVPDEPLFLLRQSAAADEAAESWEGSPVSPEPGTDWKPSTSTHGPGQSYKSCVFTAPGVLQDDLIYYLARHRK